MIASVLRVNTFIVTVFVSLHFHTLLSSLHSSFSSLLSHPQFSSRSPTLRVSFIYLYCQLYSKLSSHPLTSISTPHIGTITSIDHHFLHSLLLSPPLPFNMPVRGLCGAHTLPVPALCGHGKGLLYFFILFLYFFIFFWGGGGGVVC